MKTQTQRIVTALLALMLAGCTDATELRVTAPEGASATESGGLTVNCTTPILAGDSGWCQAFLPGGYTPGLVYWLSDAPSVASVGFSNGTVTANSVGTARITANTGNATGYAYVTVVPPPTVSISGPSSITTAGTYTWTANLTGGTGSYTYTWESFNGSTWTPRGSGQSLSMYFDWTTPPIQQVRVTVNSYPTTTATYNVSVNIPRPPPGVYISGPGSITVKGTYAFTANPSNFDTPSYTWYERDCTNGSCGAWTQWYNIGQTFNRTLTPLSCSVNTYTWQLRVVVSGRSDGLTAEAVFTASLCKSVTVPID
jgi:hypothetical protein